MSVFSGDAASGFGDYPEDDADDDLASMMKDFTPWSAEERQKYLDSLEDEALPLFAEDADDITPEMASALAALRDGDDLPSALAVAAKERGNKHFLRAVQVKNAVYYREAAKEYTVGLRLCRAAREEDGDEEPTALKATILSNLAACSLPLKNYGEAVRDCRASLAIDGSNAKAIYRLARALVGLKRWAKAVEAARWGLDVDRGNASLETLLRRATKGLADKTALDLKKKQIREKRTAALEAVHVAASSLGASLGPSPARGVHAYDAFPFLEGDDGLRWPIVFAYPENGEAPPDLLESCPASDLVADWLLTLFPEPGSGAGPAWDDAGAYVASEVVVYARLADAAPLATAADYGRYRHLRADGEDDEFPGWSGSYLEVPAAATFRDLLAHPHYVCCGSIVLDVRPATSEDHGNWRADLVRKKGLRPLELPGVEE